MAAGLTEFSGIFQENGLEPGKLRMAGTGLGWKGDFEAKASTIGAADLKWMQWIRVARGFQLRIGLKGEKRRVAYEGFEREDHERLRNAVNNYYNITLEEKETSVRGWNWGYADIQGDDLAFLIGGKPAFSLPLNTVHNTSINKAEVALELRDENMLSQIKKLEADRDNKEARRMKKAAPDEMVEIRFFIPGTVGESRRRGKQAKKAAVEGDTTTKAKKETNDDDDEMKPARGDGDASGSEAEDEEDEDQAAAETFFETIKEKAEIGQVQGATLVSFPDILCTTPRGRFDVDMFPDFLRLRGKTYDYKILYSSIAKLFLLPRTDDIHVQFIINLEPPIRQGQTRYPYLIMQFAKEEEMDAEIQLDEKEIQEKYQGKLEKRYEAPAYEVVSSVFRALAGKKVTTPGNFQSHGGHSAVKANFGAMEGHLFFLDKALLYISRNPLYVPYSDIQEVRFERVSGALTTSRTFDLIVQMKGVRNEHTFSAVSKEEQSSVEDYLKREKKLKVKNVMEENVQAVNSAIAEALMDEDSSDDDAPRARGGDDDEDSEVDEDFKADSDDDDVAEEFDENYSGSSSGDSDASSDAGGGDDDDDDDEEMDEDEAPAKKSKPSSSGTKNKSKASDSEAPAKKKQKKSKD